MSLTRQQCIGGRFCLLACVLHLLSPLWTCAAFSTMQPPNAAVGTTSYRWDLANRLMGVTLPNGHDYAYQYDYRGRCVGITEGGTKPAPTHTAITFSDGLSGAEWDTFDITLLRPAGWTEAQSREVEGHAEVWVDFEELNARGWAEVIEEGPCPPIAGGSGRVVAATITHANDDVRTLTMSSGETLYVTGSHRMYSATQADWVPVKHLRIGEELQTSDGRKSVASLGFQKGRHQVYNIEVEAEHRYFVGNGEVLTHNACKTDGFVYLRTDKDTKEEYVGQADSEDRFKARQQEHADANPDKKISFAELERVPKNGQRSLDVAEEDWIRAGGGPKKQTTVSKAPCEKPPWRRSCGAGRPH